MSPVKAAKDIGEFTSPWAVVAMVAYLIYTGQTGQANTGNKPEDLAKIAAAAATEARKAPSEEVVNLQLKHVEEAMKTTVAALQRIEDRLDPLLVQNESNGRRLDAIELWISKQVRP